jgi:DNA-binding beta-propeller fold protein YncE
MLVIDPTSPTTVYGAFDAVHNVGVVPLNECSPNGATVGPHDNLLLGCTPGNNPNDTSTLVINAKTKNFANIGNITGSDEVWFNAGDNRYYTGSSRFGGPVPGVTCPDTNPLFPPAACPVLGVINAETNLLIEVIPQGSGGHSVAADSERNRIYVAQVAPRSVVGAGGDTTTVGAGICGGTNGCIAVYRHHVDDDEADLDHDRDHGDHDHDH